jgi:four helix bundle protein
LIEQLEAASCSFAQNIAGGKGRYHSKEYVQFLYIARGSLYETITLLELFCKQNWITTTSLDTFKNEAITIAKMLNRLISSIKKQRATGHELSATSHELSATSHELTAMS